MFALLLMIGCGDGQVKDTGDSNQPPPCDITITRTTPDNGEGAAYYRSSVEFHLSEADESATVLADVDGVQSERNSGSVIIFTPNLPLDPQTGYAFSLEYCRGIATIEFTTSDLGEPLDNPALLEGRSFSLDLNTAEPKAGEQVAETAAAFFNRNLLASVLQANDSWLWVRIGAADASDPSQQDFCSRTLDLPSAEFTSSPFFELASDAVNFNAYAASISLLRLEVTGTFAADGSRVGGITFNTILDARDLAELIPGQSADSLCEITSNLYMDCEACPTDGEAWCFTMAFDELAGSEVDLDLEEILEAETDPRCDTTEED